MQLNFTLPGNPRGKERARFSHGHAYTPTVTRHYEELVGWAAKDAGALPLDLPVMVHVRAFFELPKRRKPHQKPEFPCLKRPDADNIGKIICDGLNGVAYKDDAQVYMLLVEKRWADIPRVEVTIRYGDLE